MAYRRRQNGRRHGHRALRRITAALSLAGVGVAGASIAAPPAGAVVTAPPIVDVAQAFEAGTPANLVPDTEPRKIDQPLGSPTGPVTADSAGVDAAKIVLGPNGEAQVAPQDAVGTAQVQAAAPLPVAPGDTPPTDAAACLDSPGAASAAGRVHNRFLWCQKHTVSVEYVRIVRGQRTKVGDVDITYQAVVAGRMDDRSVRVFLRTEDDAVDVDSFDLGFRLFEVPSLRFWILPDCTQALQFCTATRGPVSYPYAVWDNGTDWVHWDIFSHEQASTSQDRVLFHDWRFRFGGEGGPYVYTPGVTDTHSLRCDSAGYFQNFGVDYPRACIVNDVIPHLTYSVGDARVSSVARHIRDAQNTPDRTFPVIGSGKEIPGKYTGSREDPALHRTAYGGSTYNANVAEKDRACQARPPYEDQLLFGWVPPGEGQQCDEYPFATTEEGAGSFSWDFSVRAVPASENGSAGGILNYYYFADRILYGSIDNFYVEIVD